MAANDIGLRIGIDGEKEFHQSILAVNAQLKSLGAEMKAVSAEFAANANSQEALAAKNEVLGRSMQTAREKLSLLDSQLERQREKLSALGAELDRVIAAEGENSTAAAKAQNAYNQQYREVANLERQYQSTRGQIAAFQNAMDGVEDSATAASKALAAQDVLAGVGAWSAIEGTVRSVTAALQDAVATGMEFDASVADIAATMGTTVSSLGELRGFALEMGATTAFTATEASQALNYMALAGYDAQTSIETLPNVLNLAAAGGIELAMASDMVTDAQSALGLSMEETTRLVDEMAKTSTKTNTSVGQLGEAVLTVGGTAKFMAGGTAELNQVLGVLADNSIKGAEGGTKLRNIILSLTSPTEKGAAALEKLGVSAFDAEGNMREFSSVFPELQKSLSRLTSQEQIAALSEIFNSRDIAAAQALLGTTTERWDELAASIDGAAGSAEKMSETRLDNLAGDLTLMGSAADSLKIAFSDSLTPALRDVTQVGTGILTFAGEAVNQFPILGQAALGLTAGIGALTVGMGAMSAASALGYTSIQALTTAIISSPVAPFALAIGVGVTAVTALAHAVDEAESSARALAAAMEENIEAAEAQSQASAAQRADVESLAAQLGELANKESRTAGEKEKLLAITEQLNQAVPGLGLSYDALKDSLSMTTDQVLELARAQADAQEKTELAASIVQAERDQAQAVKELEQAQLDLAAAVERRNQAMESGTYAGLGYEFTADLDNQVRQAEESVSALEAALAESKAQVAEMEEALEELAVSVQNTGDSMAEAAQDTQDAAEQWGYLIDAAGQLEEATLYVSGAHESLSDALKEQEKSGSLSLETTKALIDAGYGAALALDEESGAVTVNEEAYLNLAAAQLEEKIQSLENQKQSAINKQRQLEESAAVNAASDSWMKKAAAIAAARAAEIAADQASSIDEQIRAMKAAQDQVLSFSGAATTAARRSSGASKKIKTQAEKDLADYKAMKADLDHDKAMGLVEEGEYYRRLGELRDQYLTDAGNLDEYRKVSETIYKADEKALQDREKLWQSASDNILKLEEDFQNKLSVRAGEILNSYKLFDEVPKQQKVSAQELLKNLQDQNIALEEFYSNLDILSERGVDSSLVESIRSMGVSAKDELAALVSSSDSFLERYSEQFGKKQAFANEQALKELGSLRTETDTAILEQLNSVGELYDTNGPALGLAFANSLADGMFEGIPAVEAMAQTVASAAMSAFEATYNRDVEAMMTQPKQRVTSGDIGELLAGAVNGINVGAGSGTAQPMNITIQTRDGIEIARAFLPDIRTAQKETPEVLDDT